MREKYNGIIVEEKSYGWDFYFHNNEGNFRDKDIELISKNSIHYIKWIQKSKPMFELIKMMEREIN